MTATAGKQLTHRAWKAPTMRCCASRGCGFGSRSSAVLQRRTGWMKAVDGIDLSIEPGETLALVGELGIGQDDDRQGHRPRAGRHRRPDLAPRRGHHGARRPGSGRRRRGRLQMIFQDPTGSLNPRRTVGQVLPRAPGRCTAWSGERPPEKNGPEQLLDEVGAFGPQAPPPTAARAERRAAPARRHRPCTFDRSVPFGCGATSR